MSVQKTLDPHFAISVSVRYDHEQSQSEAGHHLFIYKIKITNNGSSAAQLISRHWIITDAYGQVEEVRGAGVVGQQPKIQPGQSFEYESLCPLPTSHGTMKGFYSMVGGQGDSFEIEIPEFYLIAPCALH